MLQKIKNLLTHIRNDSLYRNSVFLLANNVVLAGFGFVFWAINTRLYTTEQIGIASTIISMVELLSVFSLLGLHVSVVRYLAKAKDKSDMLNTIVTTVLLTAVASAIIFLVGIQRFSPELVFLKSSVLQMMVFILFVVVLSLSEITKSTFRAFLSAQFVLLKNVIYNVLKIALVFGFLFLGSFGIIASWTVSLGIAVAISFFILMAKFDYRPTLSITREVIKEMAGFSFGNYITEFFERAPRLVLPLIITSTLGASETAYYYINMSLASFIFLIGEAVASSFYAEGSADEQSVTVNTKKALRGLLVTLLPAILIIVLFGQYILLFFGKEYSTEGFRLLQILSLAGIPTAANAILSNTFRIKHMIKEMIVVILIGSITTVALSYFLISYSLMGIGIAWIAGQIVMNIAYLVATRLYTSS